MADANRKPFVDVRVPPRLRRHATFRAMQKPMLSFNVVPVGGEVIEPPSAEPAHDQRLPQTKPDQRPDDKEPQRVPDPGRPDASLGRDIRVDVGVARGDVDPDPVEVVLTPVMDCRRSGRGGLGLRLTVCASKGAARLMPRIRDYVDLDDTLSLSGAERFDYAQARLPPPANWFMAGTPELKRVLGMENMISPEQWRRLRPLLTPREQHGYNYPAPTVSQTPTSRSVRHLRSRLGANSNKSVLTTLLQMYFLHKQLVSGHTDVML